MAPSIIPLLLAHALGTNHNRFLAKRPMSGVEIARLRAAIGRLWSTDPPGGSPGGSAWPAQPAAEPRLLAAPPAARAAPRPDPATTSIGPGQIWTSIGLHSKKGHEQEVTNVADVGIHTPGQRWALPFAKIA